MAGQVVTVDELAAEEGRGTGERRGERMEGMEGIEERMEGIAERMEGIVRRKMVTLPPT